MQKLDESMMANNDDKKIKIRENSPELRKSWDSRK